MSPERVAAVVVAFNRRELLLEVLDGLADQTVAPYRVIVVDNASTDGSADAARGHRVRPEVSVLPRNTGGAGGFAVGAALAVMDPECRWLWLMDDDTVPTQSALAELVRAATGDDGVVLAGSRVVWTDGRDHPMNTPRRKPWVGRSELEAARARGVVPVRSSSFVSMLVRASRVRTLGLPIADYFIWNDDFEFSTRMLRGARGVFAPASVVVHKTAKLGSTDVDPGPRFYYEVRNKLWMLRRSRSLNPAEKVLYGASSVVRWVRTFAISRDRRTLREGFWRGMRHGLRSAPRPNGRTLAGLGPASSAVRAAEAGQLRDDGTPG